MAERTSTSLRIAILSREYRGVTAYSGGIGTFFSLLAPRLARAGHDVSVVTIGSKQILLPEKGLTIHVRENRLPASLWYLGDFAWALWAPLALREAGTFDLVLAAEWGGDAAFYALLRDRPPLITQLTTSLLQIQLLSDQPVNRKLARKYWLQRRLERLQARRSDAIVACSTSIMSWSSDLWGLQQTFRRVIGNFTDVRAVREAATSPLPLSFPSSPPRVLFIGRLEPRKGVQTLLAAMEEVWRAMPDVQLVLLGEDHRWQGRSMVAHLSDLAGANRPLVHFLGNQPPPQVFSALATAEVVVFPSLWENFSLATLEARAQGAPVITTSGSGFDDFVHDGIDGLAVKPGDANALALAIVRLLRDKELRRRLGRAAAQAEDNREAQVLESFVAFFHDALASSR